MDRIAKLCDLEVLDEGLAWLLGVAWLPSTIVSVIRCLHYRSNGDPDYDAEAGSLQEILPGGLEVIGVLVVSDSPSASKCIHIGRSMRKLLGSAGSTIGVVKSLGTGKLTFYTESLFESQNVVEISVEEFWNSTRLLHCRLDDVNVPVFTSSADLEKNVDAAIKNFAGELSSTGTVFLVEATSKKILVRNGSPENFSTLEAFPTTALSSAMIPHPLNVRVFKERCRSEEKVPAPVVQYLPFAGDVCLQNVSLNLDVLCLVAKSAPISKATAQLHRCLTLQLDCMKRTLVTKGADQQLSPYHFVPPGIVHPVTAIYDANQSESDSMLVGVRRSLHRRLGLRLDRPLLRAANALAFKGPEIVRTQIEGGKRLLDVHVGVSRCGIPGGQMSIVEGSYEYYHYLQDRCDDNGWGCAYRSLQTIISWFRLQHYTPVPVPTHREIQQTLVEIGDKPPSFVGSQEWIGAIELSFVLDKLLGVTSKIINVRSGAELPEKCRELAAHFKMQGTPVMIGGGVLAYTLLGVDYNELTGDCAFLILDPHYTGGEDLKSIRSGGWCGWKRAVSVSGKEFFLRNMFYNLLLPQRPQTV